MFPLSFLPGLRYVPAVQAPRRIRNLVLAGFMGTGKSTVGRVVASQLRFQFLDTDELIVRRAGKPIAAIFQQDGEAAFRQLERQVVAELESADRTVISTGGGLVVDPANLASLKRHALVVCLWASPESIFHRVRSHNHRPLLNQPDPLGTIRGLLAARRTAYAQSDVLVSTELRSVREVALTVLHEFHSALRPSE